MKTKEQILEWLNNQPWAIEFYKTVFTLRPNAKLIYNCRFIASAFSWIDSPEGLAVWAKRDKEFRKWYKSPNGKPMSWEEYCEQNPIKVEECYIDEFCDLSFASSLKVVPRDVKADANVMSKDLCEAFVAYMKLIQLRNAWVKDCNVANCSYKIEASDGAISSSSCACFMAGLSFPTHEMANEFLDTFKDLLEIAKPLL